LRDLDPLGTALVDAHFNRKDLRGNKMLSLMESGVFPVKSVMGRGLVTDSSPDPFPEPIFGQTSGDGVTFGCLAERRLQRPPAARQYKNVGKMGNITSNRIDKEALYQMAPKYLTPLRRIMSEEDFLSAVLDREGLRKIHKKVSRYMINHEGTLCSMGILEKVNEINKNAIFMPLFTVPKKTGELRLIQDARDLNDLFARPERMDLPTIHEVIRKILSAEYVAQSDAVSYFYQFGLAEGVKKFFSARLAGARGITSDFQMVSMPMGWSHAPLIAQRCSNVLIQDVGVAWVDNYFVLGDTLASFEQNRTVFLDRTHKANVQLDSEELRPATELEALGLHFDLKNKQYRMEKAWVEKATERLHSILAQDTITVAELYVISGTLTWRNHVTRRHLCNLPYTFQAVGKAARQIASGALKWTSKTQTTTELIEELQSEIRLLTSNPWIPLPISEEPTAEVWSDASDEHWAFLLFERDSLVEGKSGRTKEDMHIYYAELSAALGGIMAAKRRGHKSIRVYVDNAPAAHALRRGVSSNFRACKWLSHVQDLTLEVIWVSTRQQIADPYTRKRVTDGRLPRLPPQGTRKSDLLR